MRAKDRAEYIELLKDNRMVGGGFQEYISIQEKIDTIMEQVNAEDDADVDRAVAEITALFESFAWTPKPFRDVLNGKNHLPKRKFRLTLFNKEDGFMGSGAYRQHFFGDMSLWDVIYKGAIDIIEYSKLTLNIKRRSHNRLAWQDSRKKKA